MTDEQEDRIIEYLARMLTILVFGLTIAVLISMCSCTRTVYVPQTTIQRDSIYITQYKRDSIYMHDSIFQFLKADTLIVEKWHTKYIERLSTDTLYIEKADTLRIPYPVEKELSYIQRAWIKLGKLSLGVLAGIAIALLIYFLTRKIRI